MVHSHASNANPSPVYGDNHDRGYIHYADYPVSAIMVRIDTATDGYKSLVRIPHDCDCGGEFHIKLDLGEDCICIYS